MPGQTGLNTARSAFKVFWERNKGLNNGSPSGWGKLLFLFPITVFIYERGLAKLAAF